MDNEWKEVVLEDVAEITVGYVGSMTSEYVDSGIPFLRSKNVEPLNINSDDLKFISKEFHQRIRKSRLTAGDVVIVRTGKPGSCSVVPDWLDNSNCSDLVIVRCGDNIDNRFLSYYVNTAATSHIFANLVGAVQQHFNVGAARKMRIPLPSISYQKAIAHILGSLDDKIELNRQMNETLEAIAQALFKSWFVDFDPVIDNAIAAGNEIPDALKAKAEKRREATVVNVSQSLPKSISQQFPSTFKYDNLLGWVPKEWEIGTLADMFILQRGFDLPKIKRTDGAYPLMAASGQDGTHNEFKVKGAGVVTGRSGKLGITSLVLENFWPLNTTLWIKEYKHSNPYHAFYLLRTIELEIYNSGSAVPSLNRNHIHNLKKLIPNLNIINLFANSVSINFKKILENDSHSFKLATLRDTLLPKLLSGELRIPDAEKMVAEVL